MHEFYMYIKKKIDIDELHVRIAVCTHGNWNVNVQKIFPFFSIKQFPSSLNPSSKTLRCITPSNNRRLMDMDSPPQTPIPLYETTTALSLPPTTPNRSPLSDSLEPYSVFRNEISLSSANCAAVDSAAPDFFSLDLGGASEQESEPKTPSRAPEFTPKTKLQSPLEPSLEGSWFRGNSRFRSPMLQLHKGKLDSWIWLIWLFCL